ncbi:protein of unknown function [Streptantibioticus cattleyicolor NRRL 8057 = DSM 46488]|nr:hypothetical protein [Streptomyces sp. SID5468]CCB75228.1 protein of unknown function [Streptantibioticus cattleyicolor NRRL 8057 = DSM 46488]
MTVEDVDRAQDVPVTTVTVFFHAVHGHIRVLAEHLAAGARRVPGTRAHLVEIRAEDVTAGRWHDAEVLALLDRSDAIVLGCPTLMGSVSAVFKAFMERVHPVHHAGVEGQAGRRVHHVRLAERRQADGAGATGRFRRAVGHAVDRCGRHAGQQLERRLPRRREPARFLARPDEPESRRPGSGTRRIPR